jgi:hypothetical protein
MHGDRLPEAWLKRANSATLFPSVSTADLADDDTPRGQDVHAKMWVRGAGSSEFNGEYHRAEEVVQDHMMWEKKGTPCVIQFNGFEWRIFSKQSPDGGELRSMLCRVQMYPAIVRLTDAADVRRTCRAILHQEWRL